MIDDYGYNPATMSIGAAMQNESVLQSLIQLKDADFENERDREIIQAMRSLVDKGSDVDMVTLNDRLGNKHEKYLLEAWGLTPETQSAKYYINAVKENANRRRLQRAGTALFKAAGDKTRDVDEVVAAALNEIAKHTDQTTGSVTTSDAITDLIKEFDSSKKERAKFGIPLLDQEIGGMVGGRLYVLGARPATGKSALALSAAINSCTDGMVLICSYEMQAAEIMGRIMSYLSGVSSQSIAHKTLTGEEHQTLAKHYIQASEMPIRFLKGSNTIEAVKAEAIRLKKTGNLKLIVIDYLQLMSSSKRSENRRVEVGQISRALKALTMEIDVPILALSQLNRLSEGTQSKAPTMSEMKESGDIEQDADAIILMYNPRDEEDQAESDYMIVRLLIDKNRQGRSKIKIDTAFVGANMRFCSLSEMRDRK